MSPSFAVCADQEHALYLQHSTGHGFKTSGVYTMSKVVVLLNRKELTVRFGAHMKWDIWDRPYGCHSLYQLPRLPLDEVAGCCMTVCSPNLT